jgi:hypothetical protein
MQVEEAEEQIIIAADLVQDVPVHQGEQVLELEVIGLELLRDQPEETQLLTEVAAVEEQLMVGLEEMVHLEL